MKKVVICLSFMAFVSMAQAQDVVDLKSVEVEAPTTMKLDPSTDKITVAVRENQLEEFSSNPLSFAVNNFNIQQLIKDNEAKYDEYIVTFRTKNGKLVINYDEVGEIMTTHQNFKNVRVPYGIARSIYKDKNHEGWAFIRNRYVSFSKNGVVKKEFYKLVLQKDNDRKTIKLNLDKNQSQLGLVLR